MNTRKSFLVFISEEAVSFLGNITLFIETDKRNNIPYLPCSAINEESHHFLTMTIPLNPENKVESKDYTLEISLPYHHVEWIFSVPPSASDENITQILGFHNKHQGDKSEK